MSVVALLVFLICEKRPEDKVQNSQLQKHALPRTHLVAAT